MWELDYKASWAPKNWCFWTVVLEKTLESHLDSRRSNQSILKDISPEYSLEGLMLKLKLQYFGHLMQRPDSLEKTLTLGKIGEGDRGWNVGWYHRRNGQEFDWAPEVGDGQGNLVCCSPWHAAELNMTERLKWSLSSLHGIQFPLVWESNRLFWPGLGLILGCASSSLLLEGFL